jgi:hypothetical protein
MKNVILSMTEILKIQFEACKVIADSICIQYLCSSKLPEYTAIAKAQAKHLLKILKEPCPHGIGDFHDNDRAITMTTRFNCQECMAQIEKEIEK